LFLAEGDQIQDELINKTEQDTVPNIFIKQQHIGLFYLH
jgi:glutaredoxin